MRPRSTSRISSKYSFLPRPVVNDPQGLAVRAGLQQLGYVGVEIVRVGKYIRMPLRASSIEAAERSATEMCDRLLTNPIIEDYRLVVSVDGGN